MRSCLSRLLVLIAAVQIIGGHWLALQSVAWIGMVMTYAQGESLGVALEKTFDGAHPCSLCIVVKDGQNEERKQQVTKLVVKLEAVLFVSAELPLRMAKDWHYSSAPQVGPVRDSSPPTPPPLA